jgi:capsular polysaccharide transport system permease protein
MPDDATRPSPPKLAELLVEVAHRRTRQRTSAWQDPADSNTASERPAHDPSELRPAGERAASAADVPSTARDSTPLAAPTGHDSDQAQGRARGGSQRNEHAAELASLASPELRDATLARGEAGSGQQAPDKPDQPGRAGDSQNKVALHKELADRQKRQHRPNVARREARQRVGHSSTIEATPISFNFPPLPAPGRRKSRGEFLSFLVVVVLPLFLAAGYYFFIASDQYVSEFKFVVRDAMSASVGTKDPNGMGDVMAMAGGPRPNSLESYMVTEFVKSQKAAEQVQEKIDVRKLYSRPEIDWFGRFDESQPVEVFTTYWDRKVTAQYDMLTGIATARVRAYRAEDAYLIASTLLSMSEELINNLATRPQRDAIKSAEADLKKAEDRLAGIGRRLAQYRNTEQVIDPTSNVVTSNAQLAALLRGQIAQLQTELSSLKQQQLDSHAPISRVLQSRIKATREQLASVESEVANQRDGANPLSKVMGEYERLDLERQFAADSVKAAMKTLDDARSSAVFQHMYVTAFVNPSLPESSIYPQRFASVAIVALVSLLVWTAGLLFVRAVREHIS